MARIGGRNSAMAWFAGIVCGAVVAALTVLALPAIPAGIQFVGDTLRAASSPLTIASPPRTPRPEPSTAAPVCRSFYTEALWAQLTQRVGGDPVQDAAPPATSAAGMVAALAPRVRATCTFTGVNAGRIVTTVSDVDAQSTAVVRSAFEADGFTCASDGGGVRCTIENGGDAEEQVVRDGVWLSTVFTGWRPGHYTDRVAQQLWPG